jgi:hypothetical protein
MGYEAGKRVKGRKIRALIDSDEGLPMRVVVHPAAIQDRDGGGPVLGKIRRRFPWLELIWADGRLTTPGRKLRWQSAAAAPGDRQAGRRCEEVRRPASPPGGPTAPFSWFGRNRRLAKDFKNSPEPCHLRYLGSILLAACQGVGREFSELPIDNAR